MERLNLSQANYVTAQTKQVQQVAIENVIAIKGHNMAYTWSTSNG